jgi:glyoxylase-like metal-dependent hydrolase (beta-lactamase superfamily II)
VEAPLGERFVACYLIVGSDETLLFDTGVDATPAGSILPYCHASGIDPASIHYAVISHCDVDHMGGNAAIKDALPGVSIVAHAADRRLIESVERIVEERYREFRDGHDIDMDEGTISWCYEVARAVPVDIVLGGRTELELGGRTVTVLPTPGHSGGSISIWDDATRAALTSDAVLGDSLHFSDGRPAFPPTYRNPRPYRATITLLEELQPDLLLTAHEPVMEGQEARAFLALSRSFADGLADAALLELRDADAPRTTLELIDWLAPRVGDWERSAWNFLANELVGHLEDMQADGLVMAADGPLIRWSADSGRES